MSDTDAAYLAGFFDGEGCLATTLSARRRQNGTTLITVGVVFTIVNTHKGILEWCLRTLKVGHLVEAKNTPKSPRNLPTFRFNVDANGALLWLLPQLVPWLRVKRTQALLACAFLSSRQSSPRGGAFTPEQVDMLFDLRLQNQKSYNKGSFEHVLYKKTPYTRDQFRALLLGGRDGSVYRVIQWTPDMDAVVGTDIDRRVALRLGLKLAQVQRRRKALGLPPFGRK